MRSCASEGEAIAVDCCRVFCVCIHRGVIKMNDGLCRRSFKSSEDAICEIKAVGCRI